VLLQDALIDATRHWLLPMGIFIMLAVLLLPQGLSGFVRRGRAAGG
jgi:ABC-type branched-subunit amino acid transport system permease subunit